MGKKGARSILNLHILLKKSPMIVENIGRQPCRLPLRKNDEKKALPQALQHSRAAVGKALAHWHTRRAASCHVDSFGCHVDSCGLLKRVC